MQIIHHFFLHLLDNLRGGFRLLLELCQQTDSRWLFSVLPPLVFRRVHPEGRICHDVLRGVKVEVVLYPAFHLLPLICDVLACLRLQWDALGGNGAGSLLYTSVHATTVAVISVNLYPPTRLLPVVIGTAPSCLLTLTASGLQSMSRGWAQVVVMNNAQNTRSMHSADCDTDHALVRSKNHLVPRMMHHSKMKSLPRINASRSCPFTAQRFRVSLKVSLAKGSTGAATADTKWEQMRTALCQSRLEILGKKKIGTRTGLRRTGRRYYQPLRPNALHD